MQAFLKRIEDNSNSAVRVVRIILLGFIIVGIGALLTQKMWVPSLVAYILKDEANFVPAGEHTAPDSSLPTIQ